MTDDDDDALRCSHLTADKLDQLRALGVLEVGAQETRSALMTADELIQADLEAAVGCVYAGDAAGGVMLDRIMGPAWSSWCALYEIEARVNRNLARKAMAAHV